MASGSGRTSSVLLMVEKALQYGAEVVAIVGSPGSPLQEKTDETVEFNPEKAEIAFSFILMEVGPV